MIADILRRSFIEWWLKRVEDQLRILSEKGIRKKDYARALSAFAEARRAGLGGQHDEPGIGSVDGATQPDLDEWSFFSRGAAMSILQSAIEQRIRDAHPTMVVQDSVQALTDDRGVPVLCDERLDSGDHAELFERFEPADFRWVAEFVAAKALRWYRRKHKFNRKPAIKDDLASNARIVMVGDWGSGIPRAQEVAGWMSDWIQDGVDAGIQVHVVHLGDVYYAGFEHEYRDRFLKYWPVPEHQAKRVFSWSLNGNHDMYSGGDGYFKTLLGDPRFANQKKSSWFRIQNEHWRIVGLDTAWDEEGLVHDPRIERGLAAPQAKVLKKWAAEDKRPFMLLSHHPLFSAYSKEKPGTYLAEQLDPLLTDRRVKAWFWGHEHKCIVYAGANQGVSHARCVGHGGVPVYAVKPPQAKPGLPKVEWYEDRSVNEWPEHWAYFGFAVIDFHGPQVTVRYIDQYGEEAHKETFSA